MTNADADFCRECGSDRESSTFHDCAGCDAVRLCVPCEHAHAMAHAEDREDAA